ncbi:helix-turn-helix domain-containing protein [Rhodococcus fascians]|uniref:AlkA N-terminal domain-containing protein n=1 Tax=Nocardiaceae TaxID=85025 RepID=UPI0019CFE060|nr:MULTISPECIES: AlkA N-terminal domain-containing protein [Rhodococcus]MBW4778502.1 helix-turn-helix domain-containing protein [Rhodococcus fascians]MDJ0002753.1 Ada metal-binding domain-containing protein [Rhodococcus fascians]
MSSERQVQELDFDRCYRAVSSRDARFDGQFFTAVSTTGIYCRPSCPARTPKPGNVSFLATAAAAQQSGYRACRRCQPDATPGSPRWNIHSDLSSRAMRLISDGAVERGGVDGLASTLGYSSRQLTRVLTAEVGAGPLALARAHRAHTARTLIQTTDMSMADIAFAAGFSSVRQFNDTVKEVFAVDPTTLRREAHRSAVPTAGGTVTLQLPYRAPLDRGWVEWFLRGHVVEGIESFSDDGEYVRSLQLPHAAGLVALRIMDGFVSAALTLQDMRDLAPAVARIRHLLDLDADPLAVDEALRVDPQLAPSVDAHPGIRALGVVDGAEMLLRTVIGQQISLKAAATHTARLVDALGAPLDFGDGGVGRLFPDAAVIAERGHEVLTGPAARVQTVIRVADAIASGTVTLHPAREGPDLERELLALKGIGPWTARYVVMRMLGDPDVLLDTDLVVRQGAQALDISLKNSQRWAPWRSYVSMHLWITALERRQA